MPIVTVEVVGGTECADEPSRTQALADAAGQALNSPPGQTWVRLLTLTRNQYAENESPIDAGELPVFVTVLKRQLPSSVELQTEITVLTRAIAQVIGRPAACVHVEYAAAALGRVAFGGTLVQ
jgi:phenylpyruvate tautomerase PptA (4-oxalocrotonate tautomerase family)